MDNNAQSILDAGMENGDPRQLDSILPGDPVPYLIRPEKAQVVDLEFLLANPQRKKGGAKFRDLASFARYVREHGTESTAVQVDIDTQPVRFLAIIDYHEATGDGIPGWKQHTALFAPKLSDEFTRWLAKDKAWLTQADFAEFLQDNLADVTKPSGASLLEIAKELVAKKSFDFRSAKNLSNGTVQFHYVEDMTAAGGAGGVLEVPESFTITIPVHYAAKVAYVLEARLKFKIENSKLQFRYELLQLARTLDRVNAELIAEVKAATGHELYVGTLI